METIEQIGSFAGLAAVVGLAVLSALYFSQARDVRRLREWAGRAPERVDVPQVTQPRVVARPVPKPPAARPAGAAPPGTGTAAAASAAGAAPAVASGPAAATPAAALAQDTVVHPPPEAPGGGEPADSEPDDELGDGPEPDEELGPDDGAAEEAGPGDAPLEEDSGEYEPVEEDSGEFEAGDPVTGEDDLLPPDTGERPAFPPTPPPRPTIPIGGAGARPPGSILPPYEESRPGGRAARAAGGGGRGIMSSPGRAVAVVGGSILAIAVIAFGVLQLTGGDEETPDRAAQQQPAEESTAKAPRRDRPAGVDPKSVTVAVLNGTTVSGLAAQIGDTVERQGFQLGTVTNFIDQQRAESVVKYAPGAEREAAAVGRRLGIAQREPIDAESQGIAGDATVVVVVGADKTQ
jgi:hypothetical protein